MKVVHCECGTDVEAETDDELVTKVEARTGTPPRRWVR